MDIGAINNSTAMASNDQQYRLKSADGIEKQRRESPLDLSESKRDVNKVNPEEILDRIKEISQNGEYSVRFEKADKMDEIVVKVVDTKTDEVIRQIPPEEILGVKKTLQEFRGLIIDSES